MEVMTNFVEWYALWVKPQRIMHSNNFLEVGKSSASNDVSNMERKQYLDQIHELVQAVQTLLDANIALGNK